MSYIENIETGEFDSIIQKIAKEYNEFRERTVVDLIKKYDIMDILKEP